MLPDDVADPVGELDDPVDVETDVDKTEPVDVAAPEEADPVDDGGNDEVGRGIVVKPLVLTGGAAVPRAVAVAELDPDDDDDDDDEDEGEGEGDDDGEEEEVEVDFLVLEELVVLEESDDEVEVLDEESDVLVEELDDESDEVVVLGSWPAFTGLPPLPALPSAVVNAHSFTSCTKA